MVTKNCICDHDIEIKGNKYICIYGQDLEIKGKSICVYMCSSLISWLKIVRLESKYIYSEKKNMPVETSQMVVKLH